MYYSIPNSIPQNFFRINETENSFKSLDEALTLIKDALSKEREDEVFYDYLISLAMTKEEKDIISNIRDDEKQHNTYFREMYSFYTGTILPLSNNNAFDRPRSYIEGIKKAKSNELAAVERYRNIRAGIPDKYHRDIIFEIITDELIHASKYDDILYLNLQNNMQRGDINMPPVSSTPKVSFTTTEAMELANKLGIDFSKERFDLEQFRMGLDTELEHGRKFNPTNITEDNPILTAQIALAHLNEIPDYYTRLKKLEEEAKAYWATRRYRY